jgi:hypothetical protein
MIKAPAEKPKAPDSFFKKKHIYVLLAHGEEDTDSPRVPVPSHTYVALTSECGNPLVLDKQAEAKMFAYNKQVLIPTSHPDVARAESTLELKGITKNVLSGTVGPVKFKLYTPNQIPKYDIRYNSMPSISVNPLVVMVTQHNKSITYTTSLLSPEQYITSENRLLSIYASGLYSKTHIPRLPSQCTGAPKNPSFAKTPVYAEQYVALYIPRDHYIAPLRDCIHTNAMFNALALLLRMTQGSFFSFTDICVYALLEKHTTQPVTYEQFVFTRKNYGDQIMKDIYALNEHRQLTYQPVPHNILASEVWDLTLNTLINTSIPLEFMLEYIRSMNSADTNTLLLVPVCRSIKGTNVNTNISNINKATVRRRRVFSQRTPQLSKRKTQRKRYKWKKPYAVPEPTSSPSSVVSNLGYGNYGDIPNRL